MPRARFRSTGRFSISSASSRTSGCGVRRRAHGWDSLLRGPADRPRRCVPARGRASGSCQRADVRQSWRRSAGGSVRSRRHSRRSSRRSALDPSMPDAYYNLGAAYLAGGRATRRDSRVRGRTTPAPRRSAIARRPGSGETDGRHPLNFLIHAGCSRPPRRDRVLRHVRRVAGRARRRAQRRLDRDDVERRGPALPRHCPVCRDHHGPDPEHHLPRARDPQERAARCVRECRSRTS